MAIEGPVEIELKYRLADAAAGETLLTAERLGSLPAVSKPRAVKSEDTYLDTQDGALARAGYAARLRRQRSTTIVTVKSTGAAEGSLQRRTELEGPADPMLPPADWPPSQARSIILELAGDAPLIELVTIRQLRRKRRFSDGGTTVELSLDHVEVIAGTRLVDRFTELEIELMAGDEAPLIALRESLDADPELTPSRVSKLDTALAAARAVAPVADVDGVGSRDGQFGIEPGESAVEPGATPAEPGAEPAAEPGSKRDRARRDRTAAEAAGLVVGRTPGVTAGDVVAEAGRKVLRFHLARLIAREPGTRSGADPEELHGMRVATRRMRAAWRVFGDGFRTDGTAKYRNRLRDVAGKLGAVRDLDVLVLALETYRANLPSAEQAALDPLVDDWKEQRDAARSVLVRELDSARYRRFVDDYRAFVLTPGMGALVVAPTEPHHVRDTGASRIWRAYEQVLAYGPVLRWADVPTLHQLRIASKWLRYTLEFVGEAMGPEAAPLIERVVAMQDHLGLMNDADVAATRARALLVERSGHLTDAQTTAIGRYLTAQEREVARLKRSASQPWRNVANVSFRRGLGRALAVLSAPGTSSSQG